MIHAHGRVPSAFKNMVRERPAIQFPLTFEKTPKNGFTGGSHSLYWCLGIIFVCSRTKKQGKSTKSKKRVKIVSTGAGAHNFLRESKQHFMPEGNPVKEI